MIHRIRRIPVKAGEIKRWGLFLPGILSRLMVLAVFLLEFRGWPAPGTGADNGGPDSEKAEDSENDEGGPENLHQLSGRGGGQGDVADKKAGQKCHDSHAESLAHQTGGPQ